MRDEKGLAADTPAGEAAASIPVVGSQRLLARESGGSGADIAACRVQCGLKLRKESVGIRGRPVAIGTLEPELAEEGHIRKTDVAVCIQVKRRSHR